MVCFIVGNICYEQTRLSRSSSLGISTCSIKLAKSSINYVRHYEYCFLWPHPYSHVTEVLVNFPSHFAESLLLPCTLKATPTLVQSHPNLYGKKSPQSGIVEGGVASGMGVVYTLEIDCVFEGWNLAPILALLNTLHIRLVCQWIYMCVTWLSCDQSGDPGKHTIPTLLTALVSISRGSRIIRRFLKAEVIKCAAVEN